MDAGAHADRHGGERLVRRETALEIHRCGDGVVRAAEHGEMAVALAASLEERAGVVGDGGGDDRVVMRDQFGHPVRDRFPEARAALDVGHQENCRTKGLFRHLLMPAP